MRYVSDKTYSEQITIGIFNKVLNQVMIGWSIFFTFKTLLYVKIVQIVKSELPIWNLILLSYTYYFLEKIRGLFNVQRFVCL